MSKEVNIDELKAAVIALNSSEVGKNNGISITTIGKKTNVLLDEFAYAIEKKVPDTQVTNLPEVVVNFYMKYINPVETPETNNATDEPIEEKENEMKPKAVKKEEKKSIPKKKAEPVKKEVPVAKKEAVKAPVAKKAALTPKPVKKEAPVAKKQEKKPIPKKKADHVEIEKDLFGYRLGSQANVIDMMLVAEGGASVKDMAKKCKSTESRVRSHLYSLIKLKGFDIVIKNGKYIYKKGAKK